VCAIIFSATLTKTLYMKKLLLPVLLLASTYASAQKLEVGIHGGYGTTWLINNNVSDQGDNLDPVASFAPIFGVHAGYYFPSRFGVVLELDYGAVNQKYNGKDGLGTFEVVDKVRYIDVPILIRKYSPGGFYFEVGPKFSFLSKATEDATHSPSSPLDFKDKVVTNGYRKTVVSVAFGIGGHFQLVEHLYADARLRFSYGFTDATTSYSQAELAQRSAAQDISIGTYYAHQDQTGAFSHKNTNIATGHVLLGVSYELPMKGKPAAKAGAKK
jgi:hypothetical protein